MKKLFIASLLCISFSCISQTESEKLFKQSEDAFREFYQDVLSCDSQKLREYYLYLASDFYDQEEYELAARAFCRAGELDMELLTECYEMAAKISDGLDSEVNLEARILAFMIDGLKGDPFDAWQRTKELVPRIAEIHDQAAAIKVMDAAARIAGKAKDLNSAMRIFEEIRTMSPGKDVLAKSYYIDGLLHYSAFLREIGLLEKARDIIELAGYENEVLSRNKYMTFASLHYLYESGAVLYRFDLGNTIIDSLSLLIEAYRVVYDDDHIDLLRVRKLLAEALIDEERFDEAYRQLDTAITQAEKTFGPMHSELMEAYFLYGKGLYTEGRKEEAYAKYEESERIRLDIHSDDVSSLLMLSLIDYVSKDYASSCKRGRMLFDLEKEFVRNITLSLPEDDRKLSWMSHGAIIMEGIFAMAAYVPEGGPLLYDAALFTKGILSSTDSQLNRIIKRDTTGRLASLLDEYKSLSLRAETLSSGKKDQQIEAKELRQKAWLVESDLINRSAEIGNILSEVDITWKDVSASLQKNEAAIEYVRFDSLNGEIVYAASVLLPGKEPISVPLPDLTDDLLQQEMPDSAFTSPTLFNAVFGPIVPYIQGCNRVWFSPAGVFIGAPVENIRSSKGEETATEMLSLRRLSSTRVLTHRHELHQWNKAVLFGGLDYDLSPEEKVYYADASSPRSTAKSRHSWGYLPGTLSEVKSIVPLLGDVNTEIVTGGEGVEERFKALSGQGVNLLHVSTHGFYRPDVDVLIKNGIEGIEDIVMSGNGLVFAGANSPNDSSDNFDDGLLTAEEISNLDFSDCDLVVLSACATGIGINNYDETYGLVSAFKKAGCRSILTTHWNVDDEATALFMKVFYTTIMGGKDYGDALEEARDVVRKEFPDPKYWAAFVLID